MSIGPRGVRGRAVLATVAATVAVAAVLGLASAFLVWRVARTSVEEVAMSRVNDVSDALSEATQSAGSVLLAEQTETGGSVYVVVQDAATGAVLASSESMPAGLDACAGDASHVSVAREVATVSGPVLVCGATSLDPVDRAMDDVVRVMLIALPLVVLGVAIAVWLAVGRALGSVERLRRQAERMSATSDGLLVVEPTRDEIQRLGEGLNDLLSRLHAQSAATRQFVADAGHELRNPLATLRVALEFDHAQGEQESLALSELRRLEELIEDLLALARTDAQGTQAFAEVDLIAVVADAVRASSIADPAIELGVSVDDCFVRGDQRALRSAVDNLLSNARRHCASRVAVSLSIEGQQAVLRVDDDGQGVSAADAERVFERFVRLDESRVRDAGGSGLGLAIVEATARVHGGCALAEPGPGGHFILRLPLEQASA